MPALAWKTRKRISATADVRYKVRAVRSAHATCEWTGIVTNHILRPVKWNSRRAVSRTATIEWKVGKAVQGNIMIVGHDRWQQTQ